MSLSQTTGDVRPDDGQFGRILCLIPGCGRCTHFLRSSAFNREGSALSKTPNGKTVASGPGSIRRIPV
jgi:hypothetical protein